MNQTGEALFGMNTPKRQRDPLDRGPCALRAGELGQVDPVGDDRDGIGEAKGPDLFIFLLTRHVNASRIADY